MPQIVYDYLGHFYLLDFIYSKATIPVSLQT